ncbi:unnamed protein product [Arctia plantaginis]|uniref:Uncharacterized protein n=1 Tax=Arctia plantaginis TaxID=874455 RepID=A0A8S1BBY9_ARCPL|nr:unnamed protein product [Arctia plantaginis]
MGETSRPASPALSATSARVCLVISWGHPATPQTVPIAVTTVDERESSRTKRVTRRRPDSDSDEERETVVDSGRGSEPSEERGRYVTTLSRKNGTPIAPGKVIAYQSLRSLKATPSARPVKRTAPPP